MRIGIDARMYGPQNSGLGRYVQELITNLLQIDSKNEYVLFCLKNNIPKLKAINSKFKIILINIPWYSWQEQILLPNILFKAKLDLIHFPHWNVPILYNKPFVVTIHDLIMYHYPRPEASTHGPLLYWLKDKLHRFVLNKAITKAKTIITPSEFTKQDIIKTLKIQTDKIKVIYSAPMTQGKDMADIPLSNSHQLYPTSSLPYVLYVGNAYPHKNLNELLNSWEKFCEQYTNKYKLVLVGKKSLFYDKLLNQLTNNQLKNIIYLDYQTDKQLNELYKNASLYIFPSLYEGFGLPPLEAMQYNIPIASSNSSCLPEILEDAALYFKPNNKDEIVRAIYLGLNDLNLRNKLIKTGRNLLKKYSWQQTAVNTLKIYKDFH